MENLDATTKLSSLEKGDIFALLNKSELYVYMGLKANRHEFKSVHLIWQTGLLEDNKEPSTLNKGDDFRFVGVADYLVFLGRDKNNQSEFICTRKDIKNTSVFAHFWQFDRVAKITKYV